MCWGAFRLMCKPSRGQRTSDADSAFFPLAFFQALFTHRCVYTSRVRSLKTGCARYCNTTVQVRSAGGRGPRTTLWVSVSTMSGTL